MKFKALHLKGGGGGMLHACIHLFLCKCQSSASQSARFYLEDILHGFLLLLWQGLRVIKSKRVRVLICNIRGLNENFFVILIGNLRSGGGRRAGQFGEWTRCVGIWNRRWSNCLWGSGIEWITSGFWGFTAVVMKLGFHGACSNACALKNCAQLSALRDVW
jgi:hypothetical protein